jgi:hypothetical protein
VLGVSAAALALGAGLLVLANRPEPRPPGAPVLSIRSVPAGATVKINGAVQGTTPLFIDNRWPSMRVDIHLSRPGYRTWRGKFSGAQTASVDVALTLSAPSKPRDDLPLDVEASAPVVEELVDDDLAAEAERLQAEE